MPRWSSAASARRHVWVFDAVGGGVVPNTGRQITSGDAWNDTDPQWSPDGTRIAFVSFEVGQGNLDIWVMNADGTAPMRLTQEAGPDLSPHWQPIPV